VARRAEGTPNGRVCRIVTGRTSEVVEWSIEGSVPRRAWSP